ncbi:hypothetical protein HETIRDRAFT_164565 [Heterobasidion irregulare TC 32-1]|uniref:Uncharacterized protein n=1 Tax=Heterobasidion irregulare (strain TC 32-1) TaxID=747525 RepID=W4JP97_HETIT|nr:uncharacterized protein HETIRDRAFT_164565 [Heterobasidion irregulare TC 32-1]ETW75284.1 hypothetical protein HETIRDRAFT_164565 [Heterobasidion irregulare TC 32-1]
MMQLYDLPHADTRTIPSTYRPIKMKASKGRPILLASSRDALSASTSATPSGSILSASTSSSSIAPLTIPSTSTSTSLATPRDTTSATSKPFLSSTSEKRGVITPPVQGLPISHTQQSQLSANVDVGSSSKPDISRVAISSLPSTNIASSSLSSPLPQKLPPETDSTIAVLLKELEASKREIRQERAQREILSRAFREREKALIVELNKQQEQKAQSEIQAGENEKLRTTHVAILNRLNNIGGHGSQEDIFAALASVESQFADGTAQLHAMKAALEAEVDARRLAEKRLEQEQARHVRVIKDIEKEQREPFIVPALLEAFVSLSKLTESAVQAGAR